MVINQLSHMDLQTHNCVYMSHTYLKNKKDHLVQVRSLVTNQNNFNCQGDSVLDLLPTDHKINFHNMETIEVTFGMSVLLFRYTFVIEIMHGGAPKVFFQ
jgi:hypothetical protein